MSFPRYPKYKDSGVEWLGEVPEHWRPTKLKHVGEAQIGLTYDPSEIVTEGQGTLVLRSSNVQEGRIVFDDNVFVKKEIPSRLITQAGDILICSRNGSRALIGKNARIGSDAAGLTFGAFMTIFRSSLNDFLYWVFNSQLFELQSSSFLTSTINQLTIGNLKSFDVLLPPSHELAAIASFLTQETRKIDTLAEEQRRLIELLKEKRQAVISHAVTKGLNNHALMRPSGIDWIGDVPEHWNCVRNKAVFEEVDDRSVSDAGELLTVSHITGVTPRSEKDVNMFLAETLQGYKKCRCGDLVINTMWAWMGALGCSRYDGLVSPSYNVYRPRNVERLSPAYYEYLCRIPSHKVAIKANSTGVWESRLRLYPDAFLSMRLPLPPTEEQRAIVEHLDIETAKWDGLIAEAERAIDLLQERRTALISAAVTGKIDVRGLAQTVTA